jgi:Na+/H+ antiporter NhaC
MSTNPSSNKLFYKAILVVAFLFVEFLATIIIFDGPPHTALLIACIFAVIVAYTEGYK